VVAVTGDDNSGGLTAADPARPSGDGEPAGDQHAGEPVAPAKAAERDDAMTERSAEPVVGDVPAGPEDPDAGTLAADAPAVADDEPASRTDEEQPAGLAEDTRGEPDLEQESEIAADYIEGLLDVADLDGDIDMDVEGDRPVVSVVGATLEELVGRRGEVLEALQELTRLAVHRQTGARSRIMLDVGGYRARRRQELAELGRNTAQEVSKTGVARRLQAMTPFERKVIHDAVAAEGLRSESEGEEPDRRVVVLPAVDTVDMSAPDPVAGQST
jgi:spoIIIJ-associated protein